MLRSLAPPLALLVSLGVACACGESSGVTPDEAELETVDCTKITAPSFAVLEAGIFSHCVGCHSTTRTGDARNGAPAGIDFDSYDSAKAAAGLAVSMVRARNMPYPDGIGPTNAERNRLYEWALCKTPP